METTIKLVPCLTMNDFDDLNNRIHQKLLSEYPGYDGDRYAIPSIKNADNHYGMVIESKYNDYIISILTQDEFNSIVETDRTDTY